MNAGMRHVVVELMYWYRHLLHIFWSIDESNWGLRTRNKLFMDLFDFDILMEVVYRMKINMVSSIKPIIILYNVSCP